MDVCQLCDSLLNSLKLTCEISKDIIKYQLITHQNRATELYNKIRTLKYKLKIDVSFDIQKQLPLPKHNSSPAYYLLKIWLYNLGFVSSLNKHDNCSIYQWTGLQINKSPSVIASAIIYYIKTKKNNVDNQEIYFFSDNFSTQNKLYDINYITHITIPREHNNKSKFSYS